MPFLSKNSTDKRVDLELLWLVFGLWTLDIELAGFCWVCSNSEPNQVVRTYPGNYSDMGLPVVVVVGVGEGHLHNS